MADDKVGAVVGLQGSLWTSPEGHCAWGPAARQCHVVQQQLQHEAGGLCSLV